MPFLSQQIERMSIEIISRSVSKKVMWPNRGSNQRHFYLQSDALSGQKELSRTLETETLIYSVGVQTLQTSLQKVL